MRSALVLILILASTVTPTFGQQIVGRGELTTRYELVLEGQTPYLKVHFINHGQRTIKQSLPAGLPLFGLREPCLPIVLGRPLEVTLPPGKQAELRAEVLSLSLYPHTPGPYSVPIPAGDEDEYVRIARAVHQIWSRSAQGGLSNQPLRLAQLATFILSGQVSAEELRARYTSSEWKEVEGLLSAAPSKATPPDKSNDISGRWRSSTGVTVTIQPYPSPTRAPNFTLEVQQPGKRAYTLKATWRTGFRQGFTYQTDAGDKIFAVVHPDGNTIQLGQENGDWKAVWNRIP